MLESFADGARGFGWLLPLIVGALGTLLVQAFHERRRRRALRKFAESLFWIQAGSVPFSTGGEYIDRPVSATVHHITAVDILLQAGVLGTSHADLQLMQALASLKRDQERHNQLVVLAKEYSLQSNKNEEFYRRYLEEIGWAHNMFRESIVWVKAIIPSDHPPLWPRPYWPDDYDPAGEGNSILTYKWSKAESRYFEPERKRRTWWRRS